MVFDVERFAIESRAAAHFAANKRRRQEIHFQLDRPRAFTFRTAALRTVEREAARAVAAQARLGNLREELADFVEKTNVSGGNRARRAADGGLVHFVNGLDGRKAGEGQALDAGYRMPDSLRVAC